MCIFLAKRIDDKKRAIASRATARIALHIYKFHQQIIAVLQEVDSIAFVKRCLDNITKAFERRDNVFEVVFIKFERQLLACLCRKAML